MAFKGEAWSVPSARLCSFLRKSKDLPWAKFIYRCNTSVVYGKFSRYFYPLASEACGRYFTNILHTPKRPSTVVCLHC